VRIERIDTLAMDRINTLVLQSLSEPISFIAML
jgi:hypothetical protein